MYACLSVKRKCLCPSESSNWQHEECLMGHVGRIGRVAEIFIEYSSSPDINEQGENDKRPELRKEEKISERGETTAGNTGQ
jgi:hypothetical protein